MPRGGETGHEDVEIGGHGDVFLLVLIVDFHEVVADDGCTADGSLNIFVACFNTSWVRHLTKRLLSTIFFPHTNKSQHEPTQS